MIIDTNIFYQNKFEKLINAVGDSKFALCGNLSSDMIRASDYIDFKDGVFIGEFFESLFGNIHAANQKYVVDEQMMNDLKEALINLISSFKGSFPPNDSEKINVYNLMVSVRAMTTKIQIKSSNGTYEMKKKSPMKNMPVLSKMIEQLG